MIAGIDKYFEDIEIQRFSRVENEWGDLVEDWETYKTIKGRLRQLGKDEQLVSAKDTVVSTHRLYTRDATLTELDRISYKGHYYNITAVNNVMNFEQLFQVDARLVI
jgi:SPP1 family predicted phage head-tail adaptor